MEIYELRNRIGAAKEDISSLQAAMNQYKQKLDVFSQHLVVVKRQEEAGETFYATQRQKVDAVRDRARGRAIESAMIEYDELFGVGRWRNVQQDFEAIRMIIQKNISLTEDKIQEAERRIRILQGQIADWNGEMRSLEMEKMEEHRYGK